MELSVRTLNGINYKIKINKNFTALMVKEALNKQNGIDVERMQLFSKKHENGKVPIDDDLYLIDVVGITADDFLICMTS